MRLAARPAPPGLVYTVSYRVEGKLDPTRAYVTYTSGHGSTEQETLGTLPWSKPITAGPGQLLYLSAQDGDGADGTARIVIGATELRRADSREPTRWRQPADAVVDRGLDGREG